MGSASKLLGNQGYTTKLSPLNEGLFHINLYPAGSAAGTLDDFLTFGKALVPNSDGAAKLFNKGETLNEMFLPTLSYLDTEIDYINFGFWSHEFNVQAFGHGGNTMMYSSYLLLDPISGVGIVIMTNQSNDIIYNYGLPPLIFGEMGKMAVEDKKSDISEVPGLYYSARTIHNGIGKIYSLIGLQFLMSQKIGNIELDSLIRFSSNDDTKMLSSAYGDTLKADGDIWALLIVSLLFGVHLFLSQAL